MARKNKKKAALPLPRKSNTPTFVYTSVCCGAPARKEPVIRKPDDIAANKYSESGLGKWHCQKCAKNCKVTRSKAKETDASGSGTETSAA